MRLFLAAELGDDIVHAAARLAGTLRERAERLTPAARITWVPPDRIHVTVAFIGSLDETGAAAVQECLQAPLAGSPFRVAVEGLGTFPGSGSPRVIWAGVGEGADRLIDAERELADRLRRVHVPVEERPYRPHLTLARVREAAGLRSSALLQGLLDTRLGTTDLRAITLFESRLSPKGPTYVPLQRTGFEDL